MPTEESETVRSEEHSLKGKDDVLEPYPKYKESEVPWLGRIPEHWEVRRMKHLFHERNIRGFPDESLLAATQSKGVVRKEDYENRTVLAFKDLRNLKLVKKDDFVISLRSFQGGIERARCRGIISPTYTIIYPVEKLERNYFANLFKSCPFISGLNLFVTGIRQGQNIDYVNLSRSYLPVPSQEERNVITLFLNSFNKKFHKFIRNRRRLIEVLGEYKQAVINHAVTKGLDPDAPMKDSGVEWLGKVPEHWEVKRLGRNTKWGSGESLGNKDYASCVSSSQSIPVIGGNGIMGWCNKTLINDQNIVVGRVGALCGNVHLTNRPVWVSDNALRLVWHKGFHLPFLAYLLRSLNLNRFAEKTAQPLVTGSLISSFKIPCAPVEEQESIANHIDHSVYKINNITLKAQREIDLVQEYRTRMVSDVVTGKVDVRDVEVPEAFCHEDINPDSECDTHEAKPAEVVK